MLGSLGGVAMVLGGVLAGVAASKWTSAVDPCAVTVARDSVSWLMPW